MTPIGLPPGDRSGDSPAGRAVDRIAASTRLSRIQTRSPAGGPDRDRADKDATGVLSALISAATLLSMRDEPFVNVS